MTTQGGKHTRLNSDKGRFQTTFLRKKREKIVFGLTYKKRYGNEEKIRKKGKIEIKNKRERRKMS